MSEWITCPKCGALMIGFTGGHICPLCGYRVPVYTVTSNTGTSFEYVQVIRCKDCKYYQQGRHADEWLWCMMNHHYTDEEKYCAWAERKEE